MRPLVVGAGSNSTTECEEVPWLSLHRRDRLSSLYLVMVCIRCSAPRELGPLSQPGEVLLSRCGMPDAYRSCTHRHGNAVVEQHPTISGGTEDVQLSHRRKRL